MHNYFCKPRINFNATKYDGTRKYKLIIKTINHASWLQKSHVYMFCKLFHKLVEAYIHVIKSQQTKPTWISLPKKIMKIRRRIKLNLIDNIQLWTKTSLAYGKSQQQLQSLNEYKDLHIEIKKYMKISWIINFNPMGFSQL